MPDCRYRWHWIDSVGNHVEPTDQAAVSNQWSMAQDIYLVRGSNKQAKRRSKLLGLNDRKCHLKRSQVCSNTSITYGVPAKLQVHRLVACMMVDLMPWARRTTEDNHSAAKADTTRHSSLGLSRLTSVPSPCRARSFSSDHLAGGGRG